MFPRFFDAVERYIDAESTTPKDRKTRLRTLQYWRAHRIPSFGRLLASNPELLAAFVADLATQNGAKNPSLLPENLLTSEDNFATIDK